MFVLLTGATGLVGQHIASQLLDAGHTVRAVVRQGGTPRVRALFPSASTDRLQVVEMANIGTDDFSDALKGVEAIIHCASPVFDKGESNKVIFEGGYNSTENICQAAIKAGIKRVVLTGSGVSLMSADWHEGFDAKPLDANSYGDYDIKTFDYKAANFTTMYQAVKTLSDKRVWELAKEHPDVDFTIIVLPQILGAYLDTAPEPKDFEALGSVAFAWGALIMHDSEIKLANAQPNPFWLNMDVKDAAKAHVLALTAPRTPENRKRLLVSTPELATYKETIELVRKERPEIAHRLPAGDPPFQFIAPMDCRPAKELLGIDYIPWQKSVLESLDVGLKLEKRLLANKA